MSTGAIVTRERAVDAPRGRCRVKAVILVLLLLAVAVAAVVLMVQRPGPGAGVAPAAPERAALPVEMVVVQMDTVHERVRGVGTLRASATVQIRPEVSGRIRAIGFQEGLRVEEGQLLFEIDDEKMRRQLNARQAALRAAEAHGELAMRTLEHVQRARQAGAGTDFEVERVQSELDAAIAEQQRLKAELALVEEQMRDARVTAPISGMISERRVDAGGYVAVGDVLATIYQSDPLEIAFSVPELHMARIELGQQVRITLDAFGGEEFAAVLDFVSPVVDEASRTFFVKASVPNPQGRLMPGAFATAVVTTESRLAAMVPEEALVGTRRGYMVFVVEDGIARSREVQTGIRQNAMAEIVDGIEPGERIVRSGHMRLSGGERVADVQANSAAVGALGGDR